MPMDRRRMLAGLLIAVPLLGGGGWVVSAGDSSPRSAAAEPVPTPSGWMALHQQGAVAQRNGDLKAALDLASRSLALVKTENLDPVFLIASLTRIAEVLSASRHYQEAAGYYRRALEHTDELLGNSSPAAAKIMQNLGDVQVASNQHREASEWFQRALVIQEARHGHEAPALVDLLNRLLRARLASEAYPEARDVLQQLLVIEEKTLGADHHSLLGVVITYGRIQRRLGDFADAERLFRRALRMAEAEQGEAAPFVGDLQASLGELLHTTGRLAEAQACMEKAVAIGQDNSELTPEKLFNRLFLLARIRQERGDFAAAESFYRQILDNQAKPEGSAGVMQAEACNNLGVMYQEQGRLREAEEVHTRAISLAETISGQDSHLYATALANLAALRTMQTRGGEALPLYRQALAIVEGGSDPRHPDVGIFLSNIASLMQDQGDLEGAEAHYRRALDAARATQGNDHPEVAIRLSNMSTLLLTRKQDDAARVSAGEALEIALGSLGENHPVTARILSNNAVLHLLLGEPAAALGYARRAFDAETAWHYANHPMLSELQRIGFGRGRGDFPLRVALTLALAEKEPDSEAARVACQMVLRDKGKVLDSMIEDRGIAAASDEGAALLSRLRELRQQHAAIQLRSISDKRAAASSLLQQQSETLRREQDQVEQDLARVSGAFRNARLAAQATPADIVAALPSDTVLVDYIQVVPLRSPDPQDVPPAQYAAFVYTAAGVRLVSLGDADAIDTHIRQYRQTLLSGGDASPAAEALAALVWRPLAPYVANSRRLLICPDGQIGQLAFAALPGRQGRYLVEDHEIGDMASPRDLLRASEFAESGPPVLFGDPVFNRQQAVAHAAPSAADYTMRGASFTAGTGDGLQAHLRLPPLPSSRTEVQRIQASLTNRVAVCHLGEDASKANLLALRAPDLLHLATHAYYIAPELLPGLGAMHRSGIALSGAAEWRPESGAGAEGILTAYEMAGLDLRGTRLVVVSGCDAGLGDRFPGEGLMGLRRALMQAGARQVILTLWPIEDRFACDFMDTYYREFMRTGDAISALAATQRQFAGKASPALWAPFVASVHGHL